MGGLFLKEHDISRFLTASTPGRGPEDFPSFKLVQRFFKLLCLFFFFFNGVKKILDIQPPHQFIGYPGRISSWIKNGTKNWDETSTPNLYADWNHLAPSWFWNSSSNILFRISLPGFIVVIFRFRNAKTLRRKAQLLSLSGQFWSLCARDKGWVTNLWPHLASLAPGLWHQAGYQTPQNLFSHL